LVSNASFLNGLCEGRENSVKRCTGGRIPKKGRLLVVEERSGRHLFIRGVLWQVRQVISQGIVRSTTPPDVPPSLKSSPLQQAQRPPHGALPHTKVLDKDRHGSCENAISLGRRAESCRTLLRPAVPP
jgi:hypothetical protein